MSKKILAIAAALATMTLVGSASAEEFGSDGQIILGADRLWGLSMYKITDTTKMSGQPDSESEDSHTGINFLVTNPDNPYVLPRLAFDYAVSGGITVGGSLGYASGSGKTKATKPVAGPETDLPETSLIFFAPRAGYVVPITDGVYFWPRAGVTYYSAKSKATDTITVGGQPTTYTVEATISGLSLNIEPMFVISPFEHVGITIGPVLDKSLSGTKETKVDPDPNAGAAKPEHTFSEINYGIASGIIGWF